MCKGDVLYRALNIVFEVLNDLQVVHNTISLSLSFGFGQDYTKNLQTVYETFIMAFFNLFVSEYSTNKISVYLSNNFEY